MSYDQVISLIGPPTTSDTTGDITTCVWNIHVLRGMRIVRIVVFQDGKVISITNG